MFIIEALRKGIAVKRISRGQGHKDGGVLILKTYSEVIEQEDDREAGNILQVLFCILGVQRGAPCGPVGSITFVPLRRGNEVRASGAKHLFHGGKSRLQAGECSSSIYTISIEL